jgi:hypothetical protein
MIGARRELTPPLFTLAVMVAYLNESQSIVFSVPRIAVTWTCDHLDWFSLIILVFINTDSPSSEPHEKE